MANKLETLIERGVVRDAHQIRSFSDLVFAEGMRQAYPDRAFLDVGGDDRYGPYLQASQGDAARLQAEGYRVLTIHPKDLALLSEALRAAGHGIRWGSIMTPMCALLPLAVRAGVVAEGTQAADLLDMHPGRGVRIIGKPGGSKRIMLDQLVSMAALWTYASRRLEPENGWGPLEALPKATRTALDEWTNAQLLEHVIAQQKALEGAMRLALALFNQKRDSTRNASSVAKQFGEASDDRIRLAAEKYMRTGRNWMSKGDASKEVARDLGKPGKDAYILKRLCNIYPGAAWPSKPRKTTTA